MEEMTDGLNISEQNKNRILQAQANASSSELAMGVDRISDLPDDILISIISALHLNDATATAVLSSRWRHLYTRITRISCLCLPAFEERTGITWEKENETLSKKKLTEFVNKMDHILDSCKGIRALKEFRLRFPDFKGLEIELERWLEFAFTRETEIIDIRLVGYAYYLQKGPYAFSVSTLITKINCPSFKSVKELHLCNLMVDDLEVELVVSNFTLLECLSIESCSRLKNVCVVGNSSSKLKHLGTCSCSSVESVYVANMTSLVSLRWRNMFPCVLMLDNVPNLAKLITCDGHMRDHSNVLLSGLRSIRVNLNKLSHLQLHLCPRDLQRLWRVGKVTYKLPKLINVKHLELQVDMCVSSANHLVPIIDACPLMEKLEITFTWGGHIQFKNRKPYRRHRINPPFKQLKQVCLSGFLGCPVELGLVFYIIDKAVALEELIVEAFGAEARARAWLHLQPAARASVNLTII